MLKKVTIQKASVFLAIALLFTGCGGPSSDSSYEYDNGYSVESVTDGMSFSDSYIGSNDYTSSKGTSSTTAEETTVEKKIILNSEVSIETKEYDKTMETILTSIDKANGYIQDSSEYKSTSYQSTGAIKYLSHSHLVIRIPAENYQTFMAEAKNTGNVIDSRQYTQDVTTSYYDAKTHLEALRAQQSKVMEVYTKAETIEDLITVESRLKDIEYQIAAEELKIKNYDLLTAYSTVTLDIDEVEVITNVDPSFFSQIQSAFEGSYKNFVDWIQGIVIWLIYAFPYLIIWGAIIFVIIMIYKRSLAKAKKAVAAGVDYTAPKFRYNGKGKKVNVAKVDNVKADNEKTNNTDNIKK